MLLVEGKEEFLQFYDIERSILRYAFDIVKEEGTCREGKDKGKNGVQKKVIDTKGGNPFPCGSHGNTLRSLVFNQEGRKGFSFTHGIPSR
jgi:hypothetical protein